MDQISNLPKRQDNPIGVSPQPKRVKSEGDAMEAPRLSALDKGKDMLAPNSSEPHGSDDENRDKCLEALTACIPDEESVRIRALSRPDHLRSLASHMQETRFLVSALVVDNQEMIANLAEMHSSRVRARSRERALEAALAEATRNLADVKKELKILLKERSKLRKTLLASVDSLADESSEDEEDGSPSS